MLGNLDSLRGRQGRLGFWDLLRVQVQGAEGNFHPQPVLCYEDGLWGRKRLLEMKVGVASFDTEVLLSSFCPLGLFKKS